MKRIIDKINNSQNIAIFSHIKTDCDAVCSSLALKLALAQIGKNADVFIDSDFSHQIEQLPYFNTINHKTLPGYDLYICLDNASLDRLGKNKYKIMNNRAKSVQLDHHGTNEKYCKINYINESFSSTCELLYSFFKLMNIDVSADMARLLLTGILTDTSKFSYSNTSKSTLYTAGKLLELAQTSMDQICEPIFSNKSIGEFNLTKLAYQKFEMYECNQIALAVLTNKDFEAIGSSFSETHGLCDIGLSIGSVKIVLFASQDPTQEDCYYVSVRSKGKTSARKIAEAFGGGGHFNASGCKIVDNEQNVKQKLLDQAKKELQCLDSM